jgi:hypothetical protein
VLVRVPQHLEVPLLSSKPADVAVPRAAVLVRVPQHLQVPSTRSQLTRLAVPLAAVLVQVAASRDAPPWAAHPQVKISHGQLCSCAYRSASRCPPPAAADCSGPMHSRESGAKPARPGAPSRYSGARGAVQRGAHTPLMSTRSGPARCPHPPNERVLPVVDQLREDVHAADGRGEVEQLHRPYGR